MHGRVWVRISFESRITPRSGRSMPVLSRTRQTLLPPNTKYKYNVKCSASHKKHGWRILQCGHCEVDLGNCAARVYLLFDFRSISGLANPETAMRLEYWCAASMLFARPDTLSLRHQVVYAGVSVVWEQYESICCFLRLKLL